MSKHRGVVFEAEVSRDVEPGAAILYDRSRYGNNGAMTDVTWTRLPSGLWYLDFPGNDGNYVELANSIDFGANSSLEFWGKILEQDDLGIVTGNIGFFAYLKFGQQTGTENSKIFGETNTDAQNIILDFDSPLSYDAWYHFVITKDSGKIWRLIISGVLQTDTHDGSAQDTLTIKRFGQGRINADGFKGGMALQRIYNYALSAGQVLKHFEAERSLFGV